LVNGESLIGVGKPWRAISRVTTSKWLEPCKVPAALVEPGSVPTANSFARVALTTIYCMLLNISGAIMYKTTFTIEWGDCDEAGIVFYPNYFYWLDCAFQRLLRSQGLSQRELRRRFGAVTPIVEAHSNSRSKLCLKEKKIPGQLPFSLARSDSRARV
jgi:hypothetical protein